jgi:hypothetical protein
MVYDSRKHLFDADRRSAKKARKDGSDYGACISAPTTLVNCSNPMANNAAKVKGKKPCTHCHQRNHSRKSSRLCPENPKNLNSKEAPPKDTDGDKTDQNNARTSVMSLNDNGT